MDEPIKPKLQKEPRYVNVPLAWPEHQELMSLCARLGLKKRSQGAVVARLVRDELRRMNNAEEQAV